MENIDYCYVAKIHQQFGIKESNQFCPLLANGLTHPSDDSNRNEATNQKGTVAASNSAF